MAKKGTVTPLADVLPLDQLAKAGDYIQDAIREHGVKLQQFQGFADETRALHKVIQELPQNVSYNIMVPFGKAAFFPGKLVHTNELMVLLGEGYYAERSAKQTLEILTRRKKYLDSNIESVNAQIRDLRAEASFATNAAAEAAAGVVDIREEYDEAMDSLPSVPEQRPEEAGVRTSSAADDLEYERMMTRFTELEAEEAAATERELQENDFMEMNDMEVEPDISNELPKTSTYVNSDDAFPTIKSPGDLLDFEVWKEQSSRKSTKVPDHSEVEKKREKRVSFDFDSTKPDKVTVALNSPQSSKAFTGSVIERPTATIDTTTKPPETTPAKPVSRFRQRLG